jgi:2-C-methyl-D-erythritol 4-phosphate cytidylyltransferase
MVVHAIIVAGGTGSRMLNALPKQFLPLGGKPLMYYSINNFILAFGDEVNLILVVHPDYFAHVNQVLQLFSSRISVTVVSGGTTRFASVQAGVAAIASAHPHDVVMVHDAARPFAMPDFLKSLKAETSSTHAVVPALPIAESMRTISNGGSSAVDRDKYVTVQTPQCATYEMMCRLSQQAHQDSFTDEATVLQQMGCDVRLIAGRRGNIKITNQEDLHYAEFLMKATSNA